MATFRQSIATPTIVRIIWRGDYIKEISDGFCFFACVFYGRCNAQSPPLIGKSEFAKRWKNAEEWKDLRLSSENLLIFHLAIDVIPTLPSLDSENFSRNILFLRRKRFVRDMQGKSFAEIFPLVLSLFSHHASNIVELLFHRNYCADFFFIFVNSNIFLYKKIS